jgi:hypothetical protein
MTVTTRDIERVDVRKAMRADVQAFIASLTAKAPAGFSAYQYSNHLYTHPEGAPGVHVVICSVSLPNGDAALKLHAEIEHLVKTSLSSIPGMIPTEEPGSLQ